MIRPPDPIALIPAAGPRFLAVVSSGRPVFNRPFRWPVLLDPAGMDDVGPVPLLLDHAEGLAIGTCRRVAPDPAGGLVAHGTLHPTALADRVAAEAARGRRWRVSVGTAPFDLFKGAVEFVPEGGRAEAVGRGYVGPIVVVRRWGLREISLVSGTPADRWTRAVVLPGRGDESCKSSRFHTLTYDLDAPSILAGGGIHVSTLHR